MTVLDEIKRQTKGLRLPPSGLLSKPGYSGRGLGSSPSSPVPPLQPSVFRYVPTSTLPLRPAVKARPTVVPQQPTGGQLLETVLPGLEVRRTCFKGAGRRIVLDSPDPGVREHSIRAITSHGLLPEYEDRLRRLLETDPDAAVRAAARRALGCHLPLPEADPQGQLEAAALLRSWADEGVGSTDEDAALDEIEELLEEARGGRAGRVP